MCPPRAVVVSNPLRQKGQGTVADCFFDAREGSRSVGAGVLVLVPRLMCTSVAEFKKMGAFGVATSKFCTL